MAARSLAPLLPVAYGVAALVVVGLARGSPNGPTTYAAASTGAYALDVIAGLALLAAAAVALLGRANTLGWLALLAGVLWFAQDWEGWTGAPALVRSVAAMAVPLLAAPVVLLAARTRLLLVGIGVVVAVAVARALVRDPLLDPHCWRDCVSRSLVFRSEPGAARALDHIWLGTTIVLAMLAATALARRPRAVTAPAVLAALALAAYAASLLRHPLEDPHSGLYATLFSIRAVAFAALGAGILVTVGRRWRQRAAVARLADELGAVPNALATAFGDPTLEVAYWLPGADQYVDAGGRPVDRPMAANGRAATPIVRGGRPVAVVSHDASLAAESLELGSAARLALENERLQAEVRAQLEALRRSRMRITERSDAERQRLERDLHDGAQQRLLALSFDLRLARAAADGPVTAMLDDAIHEAQTALEELRQLAHGIYPAILGEAGLEPALASLADDAPVPVELSLSGGRYDPSIEAALYVAVREAVLDAAGRGATWAHVVLDGRVTLTVDDDGAAREEPLVHVADRIGALGGETSFGPNTLRAEIPCG